MIETVEPDQHNSAAGDCQQADEAGMDASLRSEMIQKSGGRTTYPQIFIGERHIGGCDDMMALERAGKLDPLLQAAA